MTKACNILKIRDSIIYNENVKKNIKIAFLGDIHLSKIVGIKDINNIIEVLYDEKPNYICLLGDIIDSPQYIINGEKIDEVQELFDKCGSIAPTIIIYGNHELLYINKKVYNHVFDNIYKKIKINDNVHILDDKYYEDENIFIGGYKEKIDAYTNYKTVEDANAFYEDLSQKEILINNLPSNKPKILLTHSPDALHDKKNQLLLKEYDMIVTGHYHNGCLPSFLDDIWPDKNGGLITPKLKFFPKFARGIIELNTGTYLVYNGGWVKMHYVSPKIFHPFDNFCNRQMDIINITASKDYENEIESKSRKLVLKNI